VTINMLSMRAVFSLAKEFAIIIVTAAIILAGYYGVRRWTGRQAAHEAESSARLSDRPAMLVGRQLTVQGLVGSRVAYGVIIVTSPHCVFSINSASFHRRLISAARDARMPLWIAAPRSDATTRFLREQKLETAAIVDWRDLSRRSRGTPSVILVDESAVVRRMWVGQLREEEEYEVLAAIADPAHAYQAAPIRKLTSGEMMLTTAQVTGLSADHRPLVISIAERQEFVKEHPIGAINIPLRELSQRADRDLSKERLNVIDCSEIDDMVCALTVDDLRKQGFRVAAADLSR
jgi:hypothetical protein